MADYQYIVNQGVIAVDTGTIRADVVAEYQAAFGTDIITDSSTPQGVLIDAETESRDAVVRNNAAVANQINPNTAEGVFLDAIWALTGGQRTAGVPTIVNGVRVMGVPLTPIPAGSLATTTAGDKFQVTNTVVLDDAGNGFATFASLVLGPIDCAANALINVSAGGPLGWEAVNNDFAGTTGTLEDSDATSRLKRRQTLAKQGVSLAAAVVSGLYGVAGVKSLAFRENYTAIDATIDGVLVAKNSIFTCIDGGTDANIAASLLENKSQGCNWSTIDTSANPAITINVVESASGQTYPVSFYRPQDINIQVQVTVKSLAASIVDPIQVTKDAMTLYASGGIAGEQGFVVGGLVSAFELAGAVTNQNPGLLVSACQVAIVAGMPTWLYTVPISPLKRALLSASNIAVTVLP